jgi:hypothetical protein
MVSLLFRGNIELMSMSEWQAELLAVREIVSLAAVEEVSKELGAEHERLGAAIGAIAESSAVIYDSIHKLPSLSTAAYAIHTRVKEANDELGSFDIDSQIAVNAACNTQANKQASIDALDERIRRTQK